METKTTSRTLRNLLTILAVFHILFFVGSSVVRDWISFFPLLPFILHYVLLLSAFPFLGVLLLWFKQQRYGILLLLMSSCLTAPYIILLRFRLLPPIVLRNNSPFAAFLYEVLYWGTIVIECSMVWISILFYRKLSLQAPEGAKKD